jgi:hypothetical protein
MGPYLNNIAFRNMRIGLTRLRMSGRYGGDKLERNLTVVKYVMKMK